MSLTYEGMLLPIKYKIVDELWLQEYKEEIKHQKQEYLTVKGKYRMYLKNCKLAVCHDTIF
jgi:hypothetical protein